MNVIFINRGEFTKQQPRCLDRKPFVHSQKYTPPDQARGLLSQSRYSSFRAAYEIGTTFQPIANRLDRSQGPSLTGQPLTRPHVIRAQSS